MTRETRLPTPAEMADINMQRAATFELPRRPMLTRPQPKGGGTIRVVLIGVLCGMTLAALAFAEPLITAHVAAQVWGR